MNRASYFCILATVLLLLLVSCDSRHSEEDKEIVWTKLPVEATVEIVRTAEERAKGLKFREYLRKNCGMYFVMEKEDVQSFWMKDTRISLSIAFMDSNNIIVSMKDMSAYDVKSTSSDVPAKYALEMERGWFSNNGIFTGDKAILEGDKVFFYRGSRADSD